MRRLLIVVLAVLVAAAAAAGIIYSRVDRPFKGYTAAEQFVEIPSGAGSAAIGRRLVEAGVVRDGLTWRIALVRSGQRRDQLGCRVGVRAVTNDQVEQNDGGALVAKGRAQHLVAKRRIDHRMRPAHRVFVVADGKLQERIVTLGQDAGARVEVVSGVDRETVVALPGATQLAEGLRVKQGAPVSGS